MPVPLPAWMSSGPLLSRLALASGVAVVVAGCAGPPAAHGDGEQCRRASEHEIEALFDRWNASLRTGDPHRVVANYAERSILLPTVSNRPRLTPAEKEEYFEHFLQSKPSGKIDLRFVDTACNTAVDAGLYTFTFGATGQVVHARYTFTYRWEPAPGGGRWLITSHHSSALPETAPH